MHEGDLDISVQKFRIPVIISFRKWKFEYVFQNGRLVYDPRGAIRSTFGFIYKMIALFVVSLTEQQSDKGALIQQIMKNPNLCLSRGQSPCGGTRVLIKKKSLRNSSSYLNIETCHYSPEETNPLSYYNWCTWTKLPNKNKGRDLECANLLKFS